MADCILFLVKIFQKPSKLRKSCKRSSYVTLKVLSNKTNLIFVKQCALRPSTRYESTSRTVYDSHPGVCTQINACKDVTFQTSP